MHCKNKLRFFISSHAKFTRLFQISVDLIVIMLKGYFFKYTIDYQNYFRHAGQHVSQTFRALPPGHFNSLLDILLPKNVQQPLCFLPYISYLIIAVI